MVLQFLELKWLQLLAIVDVFLAHSSFSWFDICLEIDFMMLFDTRDAKQNRQDTDAAPD